MTTLPLLGAVTSGVSPGLRDRVLRAVGGKVSAADEGVFDLADVLGAAAGAAVLTAGLG